MAERILGLDNIRKTYGDGAEVKTEVLHGINVSLQRGEFAALTGPSGSGKSTLLHIIGLLEKPSSGQVEFLGRDITQEDDHGLTALRGRHIGFVFQFHYLLPAFTALENVIMPQVVDQGRTTAAMRQRGMMLLERVGLADRKDYPPAKLSGGQQQRVAIARALVMNPELILADEPTGNLDTEAGKNVFALMREFNRENSTTFLIVTHDQTVAKGCDRIVHLVDGRVAANSDRLLDSDSILTRM